jgi:3-hydroxyisobutyrate dehydrogenase-like beta-hydroxyacid dehydrogenase
MRNGGEFGVIGLGKMGGGLALQALEKGFRVVGLSRDGAPDELKRAGLVEVEELASFSRAAEAAARGAVVRSGRAGRR